jgi:thiamine-phosphate pyrophosphorylase
MTGPAPLLCLVTDRRALAGARTEAAAMAALDAQCDEAIAAGIDYIQLREPDLDARRLVELARRLVARAHGAATIVLVNDRADVARLSGASIHLKSDGPPAARVRAWFDAPITVTRSAHHISEVAADPDVDAFVFGTVFPSQSKPPGTRVAGLAGLAAAAGAARGPVLAIGGITAANALACRQAGAAGIAGIGIFLPHGTVAGALGPMAAISTLRAAWSAPAGYNTPAQ